MRTHIFTINDSSVLNTQDFTSLNIESANGYSIQFIYDPLPNTDAYLKIQASLDNINFSDIECSSNHIVTSTSGSIIFNHHDVYYPYVRAKVEIVTGGFNSLKILFARK